MFGELIIPLLLSTASPEAVDFVPAAPEEISQSICEDDLLAHREKTTKPSEVQPSEKAPMHEMSVPMDENGMQAKSMPMHEKQMHESQSQSEPQPTPVRKGRCSRCGMAHLSH